MIEIVQLDKLIEIALQEDLHDGVDVTSDAIFSGDTSAISDVYLLKAKDSGVLCGRQVFERVFSKIDPSVNVEFHFNDKDKISYGDVVATITGRVCSILKAERTALNFLSNLSAISSKTQLFVSTAGDTKILDTRKTIPGFRALAKYAVLCGGAVNHRIGLFDMVMIKDNHTDGVGSITKAVGKVRDCWGDKYKIEVETRNIEEIKEALTLNIDRIMLDNMDNETLKEVVALIGGKVETEASGNMSLERIKEIKDYGIDYISIGELTHTIKVFDFSLVSQKAYKKI